MKDVYRGREQTYLKHFLLQHYLERVGYVIGSTFGSLVYVDGFSGPWKAADPGFDDTSFMIAIKTLRKVRSDLTSRGLNPPTIRCVFVEKDAESFSNLQRAISSVSDIEIKPIPGAFEDAIPEILHFVGRKTFALTFIDPTGWTGFRLERIGPILKHTPGEILINYMTDYITRFGDLPEHSTTFAEMMGGPGFEALGEEERVALYCDRVRQTGAFEFVTSTRIKKSTAERTYFHLIYGTRNLKGLREFRDVERKEIQVQEKIRCEARELDRLMRTNQQTLFADTYLDPGVSTLQELLANKAKAKSRLSAMLDQGSKVDFEQMLGSLLEIPLVWESTVKQIVKELCDDGYAKVQGLQGRQKVMRKGCSLVRIG